MRPASSPAPEADEPATVLNTSIASEERQGAVQAELSRYTWSPSEKLGAGGMAAVYRAHDKMTGDIVALKIIENGDDDPAKHARFEREIRAAGGLVHPNVCRVLSFGRAPSQLFMAMELVEGLTLQRVIKARGTLPVPVALEALRQLMLALECAHSKGVTHRDLKPANVMITPEGTLKLLDFGIAKSQEDATVTATGLLIGTPSFMAPEQILGGATDVRSDLFSAGITFLVMLTGHTRFSGLDPAAVMVKVTSEPVASLLEECPTASTAVDRFLAKLCAQTLEQRFQSATETLTALSLLEELPPDGEGPALLAAYVKDPKECASELSQRSAALEIKHAEQLIRNGLPSYSAAAMCLHRANILDPNEEVAKRLKEVCVQGSITFDPVEDPRIAEALAAFEKVPTSAGILKRLADLYGARGAVLRQAAFLTRYLRVKPTDSVAAQKLQILLEGPEVHHPPPRSSPVPQTGISPKPLTGTAQRLRTRDIMAGIETGGHVGVDESPPQSSNAGIVPVKSWLTEPYKRPNGVAGPHGPSAAGPAGMRVITAPTGGAPAPSVFIAGGADRTGGQQMHPMVMVLGAMVIAGLVMAFFGKFISTVINVTQKEMSDNQNGLGKIEENNIERHRANLLERARQQYNVANFSACVSNVNELLVTDPPAQMALDGMWIRARARMKIPGETPDAVQRDLKMFLNKASLDDPRRDEAQELIKKILNHQAGGGSPL